MQKCDHACKSTTTTMLRSLILCQDDILVDDRLPLIYFSLQSQDRGLFDIEFISHADLEKFFDIYQLTLFRFRVCQ